MARYNATYRELFQQHLEDKILAGGVVHRILELAEIYERRNERDRQVEFTEWVRFTAAFTCTRCGHVFLPDQNEFAEDDFVLCFDCRTR